MLCSISQAGFASEHWNALKTNFQHGLPTWRTPPARADGRDLRLYSCHSPLREVPEHFAEVRWAESNPCSEYTCANSAGTLHHTYYF